MAIECRAAIATGPQAPLVVDRISVDPPGPGEVLVDVSRRHRGVLLELVRVQSRRMGEIAETLLLDEE